MNILMVCLGNICRSPLAQGILEAKCVERGLDWQVDSAGTSAWHIGEPPDIRSIEIARDKGLDISGQQARQLVIGDIDRFDLILAMDQSNYHNAMELFGNKQVHDKIKLILNFVYPEQNMAVPDPYFDGGFERVFELLDLACNKIIEHYSD